MSLATYSWSLPPKEVLDIVRFSFKNSHLEAALKKRNILDERYSIDSDEETVDEWFDKIAEV